MITNEIIKKYEKRLEIGVSEALKEEFSNLENGLNREIDYWRDQAHKNAKMTFKERLAFLFKSSEV